MTLLGADPDDLAAVATSLRCSARELERIGRRWSNPAMPWWGPDSLRFAQEWRRQGRSELDDAATKLGQLAATVERQAAQQSSASSNGGADGVVELQDGTANSADAGGPGDTDGTDGAATDAGPGHMDGHRGPVIERLPLSEYRYSGTFDVRIGLGLLSTTGELTIADIGDGRRRVTWTRGAGLGAVGSVGSSAELSIGGPHGTNGGPNGAAATMSGRLGVIERRSWDVGEDHVDDLLARVGAEQAAATITHNGNALGSMADAFDEAVEFLTGRDPGMDLVVAGFAPPAPDRTESLVEIDVAASAGAGSTSLLGLGVRAGTATNIRVGTSREGGVGYGSDVDNGGVSRILEIRNNNHAALTATALRRFTGQLPGEFHGAGTLRIEQPLSIPNRLIVRTTTFEGSSTSDIVAVIHLNDLDASNATKALTRAIHAAESGDLSAASHLLASRLVSPTSVDVTTTAGSIEGHSGKGQASAAVGIGAGISVRGSAVLVNRGTR